MDDGDGLLYMRARYYAPELMRFVNADVVEGSLAMPATLNRYAFANGNPVSYLDPFGRSAAAANVAHMVLDGAGFIPAVGAVFDVANGIWYAAEGDWANAGLSALGAIPAFGDAASAGKIGAKALGAGADALSAAGKGAKAEKVLITRTVDDLVAESVKGEKKRYATQFIRTGGYEKALEDFYSLELSDIHFSRETLIGTLPDGRTVNVRNDSSVKKPTLEIFNSENRKSIKFRYE